jgi:membrane protease subunit (stomatin/prohibitin family)
MVHGEFSFRVTSPEQLIVNLVGTGKAQAFEVQPWMREQVLKTIRDRIAQLLVKNKWPLLDVTSGAYTEEVETEVLGALDAHVATYGLKIVRMGNFVVAIEEKDAANLKKLYTDAAYLRTVGGVGAFRDFAAGKAMMGAGEGMAKGGGAGGDAGGMLSGAGLGVGFGMANMMMNQQGQNRGGGDQGGASPGGGAAPGGGGAPAGGAAAAGAKFCHQCGGALPGGAKFCPSCGQKQS